MPLAFYAVTSIAVIGLYLAFAIPIYLRWRHGDSFDVGTWNNGAKYKWMNPIAVAEIVIVSLYLMMPTTPLANPFCDEFDWKFVNYAPIVTLGALIILTIWWKVVGQELVHRAQAHHRRGRRQGVRGLTEARCRGRGGSGTDSDVDALLDQVPALAGPRSVADLPGGLTNRNLRVTTSTGDFVVRLTQSDAGLLGIDRDAEHANTRAAAEAGVGAEVVDYRPDLGMLVITFLPGTALTNETIGRPGVLPRVAAAVRQLQAGPRFVNDFDMFARQAGYLALVRERGFALPTGYDDFAPQWERVRRALAAHAGPTVPVQQRPARRQLHRRRRAGLADRLRVLRQQRPGVRARQHRHRVRPDPRADRRAGRGVARRRGRRVPGPGRPAVAVLGVRLVALGLHPGRHQPARLRLPRLGDGAVRQGRPHASPATASTPCSTGRPPVVEEGALAPVTKPPLPDRARGS